MRIGRIDLRRIVRRFTAQQWLRLAQWRIRFSAWSTRRIPRFIFLAFALGISGSLLSIPRWQEQLRLQLSVGHAFDALQTLIVSVGGALIGATAITFSLVMFAVQVNIERMPHGLFRKLSSDPILLGTFALSFVLAILVAMASLVTDPAWWAPSLVGIIWATVIIIALLLYAYQRALKLINPIRQLQFIVTHSQKSLRRWGVRARRLAPLFSEPQEEEAGPLRSSHDMPRLTFFALHRRWADSARQGVRYAMTFARQYAEQGDHEVCRAALEAVVTINSAYIDTKGKTFFTTHLMSDGSPETDAFINETLEALRQFVRAGLQRSDEEQVEQTFLAFFALTGVYLRIDYSTEDATRVHANLAAGYLASAVESVIRYEMPDVLMEGTRLVGQAAQTLAAHASSEHAVPLVQSIGAVACAAILKKDMRPVTTIGVEALARLTFDLIRNSEGDVGFTATRIKWQIAAIAGMVLTLPDSPIGSIHVSSLAPYYSTSASQALPEWLRELVNYLMGVQPQDEKAQTALDNLQEWAEDLNQSEKKILLAVIEKRSPLIFDVIHWIQRISEYLLAASVSPAASEHIRGELQDSSLWLISVLSWIPRDRETVAFVENYGVTEALFEAAGAAHERGCEDIVLKIRELLLVWTVEAGRHQVGWAILERGLEALAVISVGLREDSRILIHLLSARLGRHDAPTQEVRSGVARELRERADTLGNDAHHLRSIERAMSQLDARVLAPLLEGLAEVLSPLANPQANDPPAGESL